MENDEKRLKNDVKQWKTTKNNAKEGKMMTTKQ